MQLTNHLTIVPVTEGDMLDDVAELHMDAFAGHLNTLLGRGYIRAFVKWFIRNKGTIAIAAIDENQKVVGYALGAPVGYSTRLNRDLCWNVAARIFARPWLIFNARFWIVLVARTKSLMGLRQDAPQASELPGPSMSLVAIGVASAQRRNKIGQRLLCAIEGGARDFQMQSLVLSVYENATTARRFYEQCGWRPCSRAMEKGDVLKYYRLLGACPTLAPEH